MRRPASIAVGGERATRRRRRTQRGPVLGAAVFLLLAGCTSDEKPPAEPAVLRPDVACALDGMLLAYHDGPKAQILRRDGTRLFYCDTKEVFAEWLDPVRRRRVAGLWFQALEDGPWEAHAGGWTPGDSLFFVAGSRKMGGMGPTLAPFRTRPGAEAFVAEYGGAIRRCDRIDAALLEDLRTQGMDHLDSD